jgi:hypothetical protein
LVVLNFCLFSVSFKVSLLQLIKISIKFSWFQLNMYFFHVSLKVYDTSYKFSPQSNPLLFTILLKLLYRIILQANLLLSCDSHHLNIPLSLQPLIFEVKFVYFVRWRNFLRVALLWKKSWNCLYEHYEQVEGLSEHQNHCILYDVPCLYESEACAIGSILF